MINPSEWHHLGLSAYYKWFLLSRVNTLSKHIKLPTKPQYQFHVIKRTVLHARNLFKHDQLTHVCRQIKLVGTPNYNQKVARRYRITTFNGIMSTWVEISFSIIKLSLATRWQSSVVAHIVLSYGQHLDLIAHK